MEIDDLTSPSSKVEQERSTGEQFNIGKKNEKSLKMQKITIYSNIKKFVPYEKRVNSV
jgi:hypothetical protein